MFLCPSLSLKSNCSLTPIWKVSGLKTLLILKGRIFRVDGSHGEAIKVPDAKGKARNPIMVGTLREQTKRGKVSNRKTWAGNTGFNYTLGDIASADSAHEPLAKRPRVAHRSRNDDDETPDIDEWDLYRSLSITDTYASNKPSSGSDSLTTRPMPFSVC